MKAKLFLGILVALGLLTAFSWRNQSAIDILCGTDYKAWKLQSTNNYSPSCVIPNAFTEDNKYIFYRNGNFVFDPGTLTTLGDSTCKDPYLYTSSWELAQNESSLILTTVYTDSSGAPSEQEIFNVQLEIINENQIKFKEMVDSVMYETVLVSW